MLAGFFNYLRKGASLWLVSWRSQHSLLLHYCFDHFWVLKIKVYGHDETRHDKTRHTREMLDVTEKDKQQWISVCNFIIIALLVLYRIESSRSVVTCRSLVRSSCKSRLDKRVVQLTVVKRFVFICFSTKRTIECPLHWLIWAAPCLSPTIKLWLTSGIR